MTSFNSFKGEGKSKVSRTFTLSGGIEQIEFAHSHPKRGYA